MLKKMVSPRIQRLMELKDQGDPTAFFGSSEMYLVLGAILLLAIVLFVFVYYFRKPKQKLVSHSRSKRSLPDQISRAPRERKRKRRRRWKNRNPTLSQTGGLPPTKDGNLFSGQG